MDFIGLFDMLDINGLWDNWPLSLAFAASVILVVFLKFEHDFYKAFRKEGENAYGLAETMRKCGLKHASLSPSPGRR